MQQRLCGVAPQFSGKSEDWYQFSKDWEQYQQLIATMGGPGRGQVPDFAMLKILEDSLDPLTKKDLQLKRELNPQLTYKDYFTGLEREFTRDMSRKHRSS